jgi:hypothetical protein
MDASIFWVLISFFPTEVRMGQNDGKRADKWQALHAGQKLPMVVSTIGQNFVSKIYYLCRGKKNTTCTGSDHDGHPSISLSAVGSLSYFLSATI